MKKHPLNFQNANVRKIRKKKPYFTIRFLVLGKNLVLCMEKLLEFLNKESYLDFKKAAMNGTIWKMKIFIFQRFFLTIFSLVFTIISPFVASKQYYTDDITGETSGCHYNEMTGNGYLDEDDRDAWK